MFITASRDDITECLISNVKKISLMPYQTDSPHVKFNKECDKNIALYICICLWIFSFLPDIS